MMINTEFELKWKVYLTLGIVYITLVLLWRAVIGKKVELVQYGIGEMRSTTQSRQRIDSQKSNSVEYAVLGSDKGAPRCIATSLPLACPISRVGGGLAYTESTENCGNKDGRIDLWGGEILDGSIIPECEENMVLDLTQSQVGQEWKRVSNSVRRSSVNTNNRGPCGMSWSAVASNKSVIIVYGGQGDRTKWSDQVWIRNTHESEWRRGLPVEGCDHPPALTGAATTLLPSENKANRVRFLLCGGKGKHGLYNDVWLCTLLPSRCSNDLKEHDQMPFPAIATWDAYWENLWSTSAAKPLKNVETAEYFDPTPRYRHSCVATEDHLILVGGCDPSDKHINGEVIEAFNFHSKTWIRRKPKISKGTAPSIGPGLCSYVLPLASQGGRNSGGNVVILVVSGDSAGIFNSICLLDENMSQWTRVEIVCGGDWTMVPGARYGFLSTMTSDGILYVFGGSSRPSLYKLPSDQLLTIDCRELSTS